MFVCVCAHVPSVPNQYQRGGGKQTLRSQRQTRATRYQPYNSCVCRFRRRMFLDAITSSRCSTTTLSNIVYSSFFCRRRTGRGRGRGTRGGRGRRGRGRGGRGRGGRGGRGRGGRRDRNLYDADGKVKSWSEVAGKAGETADDFHKECWARDGDEEVAVAEE